MHETLFEETKVFEEFGYANNSKVQRIFFKEDLLAYGTGFSFQLGSIIKIKQLNINLGDRVGVLEKYRWMIIGGAIIVGLWGPEMIDRGWFTWLN